MNVCVLGGAGYVGLITGLGLAEAGHMVVNVDVDVNRIDKLQNGDSPIYEDGLVPLLRRNIASTHLRFSTDLREAVTSSQVLFIAVGTPSQEDGQVDLAQVIDVTESLARYLDAYKIIVLKSTVPVDTVELVRKILRREKKEGTDFDIVANPEFLREGSGLYDFFYPDRIVIGTCSERARDTMRALYATIATGQVSWPGEGLKPHRDSPIPLVETDLGSAQMIKYASNSFLAARISFINEIAAICERVGADVKEVAHGMGFDPRIGHDYLEAGLGFGGPCLEKDLHALIKIAESNGYEPQILRAVLERNDRHVEEVTVKLKHIIGQLLYKKIVAVFGLSFKAGTNDVRNSMALKVVDRLEKEGTIVRAHDPIAIPEARALKPNIDYFEDPYEAVHQADALLILTEWPSYQELDFSQVKEQMAVPCIIDARNLLDWGTLRAMGFTCVGVGRP